MKPGEVYKQYSLPSTLPISPLNLRPHPLHPSPHQLCIVTLQLLFLSVYSVQLYRQRYHLILYVLGKLLLFSELFIAVFELALEEGELTMYGRKLLGQGGVGRCEGGVCGLGSEDLGCEGGAGGLGGAQVLTQTVDLIVTGLI